MATAVHRVNTASTSNSTTYTSGSFTPAANDLLVVYVIYSQGTAVDLVPTLTSSGITFTRALVKDADNHGSAIAIFVSNSLVAATSRTVTFTTSNTSTGSVIEVAGVSGMTLTGASAVRQAAGFDKATDGGSSTTPFVNLGLTTLTTNVMLVGGCDVGNNPSLMVQPSGWTQLNATGYSTPAIGGSYSHKDSGVTNSTITSGGTVTGRWQYAAIELDTSAGTVANNLTVDPGSYAITGSAATLNVARELSANPGSYLISGAAATLPLGHVLQATPGAYVLTGLPLTPQIARVMSADPGTYLISGADATLVIVAGAVSYTLTVDPGVYATTGADAGLPVNRVLSAVPGVYNIAGFAAELPLNRLLSANPGVYSITGADVGAVVDRILSANPGAYIVSGSSAVLQGPAPIVASRPRMIVFKRFGFY